MSATTKGKKDEPEKKPRRRIKKVAGHGGHHGGSWKVAYADFVTAMMALFLVLWLLSQADTKLKAAVANYFRSPGVFSSTNGGVLNGPKAVSRDPSPDAASEQQMFDSIAKQLKERISGDADLAAFKDRVKIDVTDEGLRIQIIDKADRVTFASGSAQLSPEAKVLLAEIAKATCQLPNSIAIGGHTDKHLFPEGSSYTNWELSADRANAARRALEAGCVKPEQVRRVVGYADTELLYPNHPFSPANRRINITLLRLHERTAVKQDETPKIVEEKSSAKGADTDQEALRKTPGGKESGEKEAMKTSESAAEAGTEESKGAAHTKGNASTRKKPRADLMETPPASPPAAPSSKHGH